MRKLFYSISGIMLFVLMATIEVGVTSCTKDKTLYDTVTVTKTDTLVIQDTAITLGLLTANAWKMQEIRGVIGNDIIFYQRGGTTNTENYDNEYIRFNADKTGILFDANSATHQITWDFSNEAKTKLTFILANPAPLESQTVIYENLRFKNNALLFDQYWTYSNVNSHAQVIRIPSNH